MTGWPVDGMAELPDACCPDYSVLIACNDIDVMRGRFEVHHRIYKNELQFELLIEQSNFAFLSFKKNLCR